MKSLKLTVPLVLSSALLSGCDLLGVESVADIRARQHEEAVAVGGACRQATVSLQDCMDDNDAAPKAGVLEGWRDMDGYIREHPETQSVGAARPHPEQAASSPASTEEPESYPKKGVALPSATYPEGAAVKRGQGGAQLASSKTAGSVPVAVSMQELVASGGLQEDESLGAGPARVPWQLREIASKREFERSGATPHGVTRWFGARSP